VTLGAAGVVVLERVGSGLDGTVAGRLLGPDPNAGCADGDAAADLPAVEAREPAADVFPATAYSDVPIPEPAAAQVAPPARISAPEPAAGSIRVWEVPADEVVTVDSTGAGDAFCGALAAALAEGRPLAEAVKRAVAGSALATTHSGAREGMPTAAELEEFLASHAGVGAVG
jgi:hypothetical protein